MVCLLPMILGFVYFGDSRLLVVFVGLLFVLCLRFWFGFVIVCLWLLVMFCVGLVI